MQIVMKDYEIFADVSIDIDKEFADKNGLKYVPMEYVLGEDTFSCTEPESDEMMHNYYEKLRGKVETHTSQIVPYNYICLFEPYVKEGKDILYISLSSGLSNTYESALMAARELKEDYPDSNVLVVDSLAATGGMGLLTEIAFKHKQAGMDINENADKLTEYAKRISYWFKVEDLMYLMRGGRVSATTAILGTALNIKPLLTVNDKGKLETIDKKRGNKQAMKAMIERFEKNFDPDFYPVVYICCSDCVEEAEKLKGMVLEKQPGAEVKITMLSPIIGAHTGPDMIALIYFNKGNV